MRCLLYYHTFFAAIIDTHAYMMSHTPRPLPLPIATMLPLVFIIYITAIICHMIPYYTYAISVASPRHVISLATPWLFAYIFFFRYAVYMASPHITSHADITHYAYYHIAAITPRITASCQPRYATADIRDTLRLRHHAAYGA